MVKILVLRNERWKKKKGRKEEKLRGIKTRDEGAADFLLAVDKNLVLRDERWIE